MIDVSKIVKTYTGQVGCMCGCLGKYSYTEHGAIDHSPGYDVRDRVDEAEVKRTVFRMITSGAQIEFQSNIAHIRDRAADLAIAIYFVPGFKAADQFGDLFKG